MHLRIPSGLPLLYCRVLSDLFLFAFAKVALGSVVLYGRPFYLFEYCNDRDRNVCEHEQREGEHIKDFPEHAEIYLFPFGYGCYRADDERRSVYAPEHIEQQMKKFPRGSVTY